MDKLKHLEQEIIKRRNKNFGNFSAYEEDSYLLALVQQEHAMKG